MLTSRRFYSWSVVLGLLTAACSPEQNAPTQDTGDDAEVVDAAIGAQVDLSTLRGSRIRLFQSSCTTTFAITEFVPLVDANGNPVIGPDGRPIPARFTVSLAGECTAGHFGEFALSGTQQVVFNADGSQSLHSESRYTTKNGDALNAIFDGTGAMSASDPTKVKFEGWERFAGGTGVFLHARGGAKAFGSADLAAAQGRYRTLGVIGY